MGTLFGGGGGGSPTGLEGGGTGTPASNPSVVGPYPDDGAIRMPVFNSPTYLAAARRQRNRVTSRSGRESTRLASDSAGTRSYSNSFLGQAS